MKLATVEMFKKLRYQDENSVELSDELLKKCQKVLLSIAEDVIGLCEEEGIWYQLGGGTALGAVRHHGFIPWDDDIDINILRKDYVRFADKLEAKYGDKYSVQTCRKGNIDLVMGRVRLKNSVYRDRNDINSNDCGFFVDIFLLENVYDNIVLRYLHGALCLACGLALSCRQFYQNRAFMREVIRQNPKTQKTIYTKIGLGWMVSFLSTHRWALIADAAYGLCKNENSKYVAYPSGKKHYFGEMHRRTEIVNTISVSFEGHNWQIAKDYDTYLTALFGSDYMTIPPEQEREHHILLELKFPENFEETKQASESLN